MAKDEGNAADGYFSAVWKIKKWWMEKEGS
jgi:hypothetical protein